MRWSMPHSKQGGERSDSPRTFFRFETKKGAGPGDEAPGGPRPEVKESLYSRLAHSSAVSLLTSPCLGGRFVKEQLGYDTME